MQPPSDAHVLNQKIRKQVTILFADIVNSSAIIRDFDPESAQKIFSQIIQQQIKIVEKFFGTVNQVTGDGIMCLFGAQAPFEEHALRAVAAGQEMIACLSGQENPHGLKIRVGINTGDVVLAKARSRHYGADFEVTGFAVHLADRILKKAGENQIAVSRPVRDSLERYYHFERVGNFRWRSQKKSMEFYTPVSRKLAKPALKTTALKNARNASIENKMLPFVHGSLKGQGPRILGLYGSAGAGKTYAVNSFVQRYCHSIFGRIFQVNFYPGPISSHEASIAHAILHGSTTRENRKMLAEIFGEEKRDFPFFEEGIKDIMRTGPPSESYNSLDQETRARLRSEATARLLLSIARRKKTLLLLEDLHWAGEESLACIRRLFSLSQKNEHLLILTTSRRALPFDRSIMEETKKIFLEPMTESETVDLLDSLDTKKLFNDRIKGKIHRLSGGNPYFAKEYFVWAQALLGLGSTRKTLENKLNEYTPERISDILYNRLAESGNGIAHLAKMAAALGLRVNLDTLQAVHGGNRSQIIQKLRQLEKLDILKKENDFPVQEWVFTHELLHRVIYQSIPRSIRSEMHADILKKLKLKKMRDKHLVLATHARETDNETLKYLYLYHAAKKEAFLSRHHSCVSLLKEARQSLARLGKRPAYEKRVRRTRLLEIGSLFVIGKYDRIQKHLDILLQKKGLLIKEGMLDKVLSFKELYLWIKGDFDGAIKISKSILYLTAQRRNRDIYIRENARLANLYSDLGRHKEAIEHGLMATSAMARNAWHSKFSTLIQIKPGISSLLSLSYAEIGDFKKSRKHFDFSYSFLEEGQDILTKVYILTYLANSLIAQDRNRDALALLEKANNHCDAIAASILRPYVLSARGIALAKTGRAKEGIKFCKQALMEAAKNQMILRTSQFEIWHAEALLENGQHALAMKFLVRTMERAKDRREEGRMAAAGLLLARCRMEGKGEFTQARRHLQLALRIARKHSLLTLEKKILSLSEVLRLSQKDYAFS